MTQRNRGGCSKRRGVPAGALGAKTTDATRRQFLSGLMLGAAGCASPGGALSGTGGVGGAAGIGGGGAAGDGTSGAGASGGGTGGGTGGTGGTGAGGAETGGAGADAGTPPRKSATDTVMLGSTGIAVSRLAMGSGTHGSNGMSDQTRLGLTNFSQLLVDSYDQGITFWETADQYGSHAHLREAIRQVGRQNVVVLTKTYAQTAPELDADLARFLEELGTDYIDVLLLHNRQSGTWVEECDGAMGAMDSAKQRGAIRAHGVSCHTLEALELAARTPWVDVDLARVNPAGLHMDSDPATVINVLKQMKAAGKGVIGMKILGEGQLAGQLDMAIQHAVSLDCIDGFTIGFTSRTQLDEVVTKIAQV
jgi:1-deoxyxylulose-5-phosphate synthase